jgi:hypothetical protein
MPSRIRLEGVRNSTEELIRDIRRPKQNAPPPPKLLVTHVMNLVILKGYLCVYVGSY